MRNLTDLQKITKIMHILEGDDILLDALAEVLLLDDGNPDVPYSTPFIPKSLRIQRLADYLNHDKFSLKEDGDKVKVLNG